MTTAVLTKHGTPARAAHAAKGYRVTLRRVVRSEWIKLWSLRSTAYTLAAATALMIGLGALFSYFSTTGQSGPQQQTFDATGISLAGVNMAQLAIGVLGVLVVTGEYANGMIRATLAAVPTRLPVLGAKAGVLAVVGTITMIAASLGAFLVGQTILAGHGTSTTLAADGVARAVVGAGLYLGGIGVFGAALGFILRSTAGAISTLFGLILVLPILSNLLPSNLADISHYLPSNAGQAVMTVQQTAGGLAPWTGFAVFCGYLVAATALAAVLLKRRDA